MTLPSTELALAERSEIVTRAPEVVAFKGDRIVLLLRTPPHTGFTVMMRGLAATDFPGSDQGTRPKSDLERMFEDASIGVYYRLSEHEMIGLEIGQDAFTQRYNGFIRGAQRDVDQHLLTPWATLNYRYRFDGIFGQVLFRPYLAMGAGFTQQVWPMVRPNVGLVLAPDSWFELQFGVEGVLMAYPFDGQFFSSKKLGFSYGMFVNF
jgi:hypothetical protein